MHGAPSVSYPVGRSLFAGGLLLGVWLAGAAATALWALQSAAGWRHALALAACVAAGVFALRAWLRTQAGVLAWDGGGWAWAGAPGTVHCVLDVQRAVLLRWTAPGQAAAWLWLDRSGAASDWDALRRAVYSRANPDALPGAQPFAAKP